MKIAPLPDNEVERLAALWCCNILDTAPEAVFNSITQLASSFCDTPICLVSLVDADRAWFKSRVGLDLDEAPRDMVFCSHAILQDDILVVPDLLKDKRFRDNPFVTQSPSLRFYAGAPLKTPEGFALGTLCVMDYQPRQMTEKQLQSLRLLAAQMSYLLERRRATQDSKLPKEIMEKIFLDAQYAKIVVGANGRVEYVNNMAETIFGYETEELVGQSLEILIPERFRAHHGKLMQDFQCAPSVRPMGAGRDLVGLCKDGTEIPIEIGLNPVTVGDKRYVVASIIDISERKRLERELREKELHQRQILDSMYVYVLLLTPDGTLIDMNEPPLKVAGIKREDVIGIKVWELYWVNFSQENREIMRSLITRAAAGEAIRRDIRARRIKDDVLIDVDMTVSPIYDTDGRIVNIIGSGVDVTERRQAERELQLIKFCLDHAPNGVFVISRDAQVTYVNEETCRMLGYTREELTGMYIWDFDPVSPRDRWAQNWKETRHTGVRTKETVHKRKDGTTFPVEISTVHVGYEGQELRVAFSHDISERKQMETALHKSEERLNQAVSAVRLGIFEHDHLSDTIYWSPMLRQIYGVGADEPVLIQTYTDMVYPEDRTAVFGGILRAHDPAGDGEYNIEHRILCCDGDVRWVHVRSKTIFDRVEGRARPVLTIGAIADITERKQTQVRLHELLGMNSRIVSNSTHGIMLFDPDGQCILANEAAMKISGAPSISTLLEWNYHHSPIWRESGLYDMAMYALKTNTPQKGEYRLTDFFGKEAWVIINFIPYLNDSQHLLVLITDVSEFHDAEEKLQEAKQLAEAASQAKGNFLANMSHEIRTPMNAILGMTHLVLETELDATQRDYLDEINTAAKSLLGILNDILDFSKIEAGKLEFEHVSFGPSKQIESLQSVLGVSAREKGLALEFILGKDVPGELVGDPLRLRQVLINIIGNAIKFTHQGKITVKISLLEKQADKLRAHLCFEVIDTGIGMSKTQQSHLFQPFAQGDITISRDYGGTGLGLAICKKLVEMMGGEIRVETAPGKGSRFHFNAWFGFTENPVVSDARQPGLAGDYQLQRLRVLLVDDVDINRKVARMMLSKVGVTITEAENGKEALELLESAPDAFDIVLMDVQMPVMDGLIATKLIRQNARLGDLPVIAMTACAMKEDAAVCFDAGMNDYVSKPFDPAELYAKLLKYKPQ